MALNFGILQPVNIGGQIMAGRQEAQRNELAQQQLAANQQQMQTGAMQQEKAQMEMVGFKRRQAGLENFLQRSAQEGKTGSPEEQADSFYSFALTQEDPQLILAAQTMKQAARERSAFYASKQPPKISPVGPAPGALGSGTYQNTMGFDPFEFGPQNAPVLQPNVPGTAVSTPIRPMATPAAPMVNQLAPPPTAAVAPVNQLGVDTRAIENRIDELRSVYRNVPEAQKEADRLEKRLEESRKLYAVGGNLVTGTGASVFTAPEKANAPPSMVAEYTFAKTPDGGGFTGSFQQFVTARAAASRAPAQPAPLQPPVAVIGPDGREIYVTREEALKNRMSPAGKVTALTESQGNATAFGMRMKDAHTLLKDLEKKGETDTGIIRGTVGGVVGLVPFIGDKLSTGTDNIFTVLPSILGGMSSEQQQIQNARINFITAVLRKESGAAISPSEFATAEKLYFPQPGNDASVVKQKQKARELSIKAMEVQAGPGAKSIQSLTPSASGASASDPLGLFPAKP